MPWEAVSPTRFERPLDTLERFFVALAAGGAPLKREHWSVTATIQIKWRATVDIVSALRNAWKVMRFDHPQIACFLQDGKKVYEIPSAAKLEHWLDQTFIVEPATCSTEDLVAGFQPSHLATLHYLPGSSTILLHSSHWRIDGIGCLHLLNNLTKALATPREVTFGSEGSSLSPSLEEAALVAERRNLGSEQAAQTLFESFLAGLPSSGLPTPSDVQIPGATRYRILTFAPEEAAKVIAGTKAQGLSVTAATHAAMVLANQERTATPDLKYTAMCAVDLRPYLEPPYNSTAHPVALYMSGLPVSLAPAGGFQEHAAKLQAVYGRRLDPSTDPFLSSLKDWVERTTGLLTVKPPEGTPEPCEPAMNSLGKVNTYLVADREPHIQVVDFWLGVEMLTRQIEFYLWTFNHRMKFSVCYNESYYSADFVDAFMARVKVILLDSLNA